MGFEGTPQVGEWYRRADRPQAFQVVAFDASQGLVEIEYFDGTIDEWPLAHWHALEIEPSAAPQDWTGAYDEVDRSDFPDDVESGMRPEDWHEPLEGRRSAAARLTLESEARAVPPAKMPAPRQRKKPRPPEK
ncbi:DUF6763 family protein [Solimonas flava]|uniref:DUF6763 family protein n=1 Tax=Solimonas flava TaxID=415849 RepID=UPI00041B95E7|nr:DUF6763 family protein [Solimonas flava]